MHTLTHDVTPFLESAHTIINMKYKALQLHSNLKLEHRYYTEAGSCTVTSFAHDDDSTGILWLDNAGSNDIGMLRILAIYKIDTIFSLDTDPLCARML